MIRQDPLIEALDSLIRDIGNLRIDAIRIKRLVNERMGNELLTFDEKTPTRPNSQPAFEAFQSSSAFLAGKKKPHT